MFSKNGQEPQGYRHDGCRKLRRELAAQAAAEFINGIREAGGEFQRPVTIKRSAPVWVKQAFRAIQHGHEIDDVRSAMTREAFHAIAEAPLHASIEEIADQFEQGTATYNADLLRWLGSHIERPGYCDQALREGPRPESLIQLIRAGQALELKEVLQRVARAIEDEQYHHELRDGTLNPESGLAVIAAAPMRTRAREPLSHSLPPAGVGSWGRGSPGTATAAPATNRPRRPSDHERHREDPDTEDTT